MLHSTIQRQTYLIIAWCLTGLLLGGSLMSALPMSGDSAVCAEESVLEIDDDDRSNDWDIDSVLHCPSDNRFTSQAWQEVQVFSSVYTIAEIPSANLQRGPPCC